jgi:hypothetical protein
VHLGRSEASVLKPKGHSKQEWRVPDKPEAIEKSEFLLLFSDEEWERDPAE